MTWAETVLAGIVLTVAIRAVLDWGTARWRRRKTAKHIVPLPKVSGPPKNATHSFVLDEEDFEPFMLEAVRKKYRWLRRKDAPNLRHIATRFIGHDLSGSGRELFVVVYAKVEREEVD